MHAKRPRTQLVLNIIFIYAEPFLTRLQGAAENNKKQTLITKPMTESIAMLVAHK